ncbi:hypothetical protein LSAT2_004157 [Lamellibrachia satsuma]|nr:hypothetical protein LSAT2_004157 [Lamellibrachia satsuma]
MSACRVVNAAFGAAFLLVSVLVEPVTEAASAAAACSRDCQIPSCYCDQSAIPGGLNPVDTPQMVLFAFNDPVTSATRKKIIDVFPDKLRNPITDCPIAITLFVVGTGSDYCAIHRLYVRGHEIATGGFNRTGNTEGWTPLDWERQLADHQTRLVEESYLPEDHVRGARAPLQVGTGRVRLTDLPR